jgi:hypothetical protein
MNQAAQPALLNIWTLIGAILTLYGIIIGSMGIYHNFYGLPTSALANLHPSLWWGAIMIASGLLIAWMGKE